MSKVEWPAMVSVDAVREKFQGVINILNRKAELVRIARGNASEEAAAYEAAAREIEETLSQL